MLLFKTPKVFGAERRAGDEEIGKQTKQGSHCGDDGCGSEYHTRKHFKSQH